MLCHSINHIAPSRPVDEVPNQIRRHFLLYLIEISEFLAGDQPVSQWGVKHSVWMPQRKKCIACRALPKRKQTPAQSLGIAHQSWIAPLPSSEIKPRCLR